jgi:hypothetical protein
VARGYGGGATPLPGPGRADLVRLEDGTWLDVLTWSCPDGEERLMRHADQFDAVNKMHALLEDVSQVGRGEIVLTSP